ncbi:Na+/H+ antiporter subunit E [Macrococcoides caseolyticum]|uniref:Na+/H+ antiporter subunit E n=1 Tax=Macrococcoides caseolyticum TaxID=69966 RepID=UPI001F181CCD|nr:Na+/H+ antiporter subunit E [Macrococcus caseolyticus]MCE4956523.1 Na+/H+ antiporter subunit E [Macrococcus caseolyticus]
MAQVVLNIFIAVIWVLMVDEDHIYLSTFIKGYLIGIVILYILHRFFGHQFYIWKLISLFKLLVIFNYELISSSLSTMYHILFNPHKIAPGVVTYNTVLKNQWEITSLMMLIILTPGSVVLRLSHDNKKLFIHTLHASTTENIKLLKSIKRYERVIKEVTQT